MNTRMLDYYDRELAYLRELGAEFARDYPKVAGRLGMRGTEVSDPYVERLLEGFCFLSARIQLKMDAEFPRFSQRLLEGIYPNYLAPTPSMAVVQFQPELQEGSLQNGFDIPAGTALRANLTKGEQTACEFRTAHQVTLWPLRLTEVKLAGEVDDLPSLPRELRQRARGHLRLRLQTTAGIGLNELPLDRLAFFLGGQEAQALRLLELVLSRTIAVLCHDARQSKHWMHRLDDDAVRHEGLAAEDALLPYESRSFQGYRLLHEYFAFPDRYLFVSIGPLAQALRQVTEGEFELTLLFDRREPELESLVDLRSLSLYCTPAINLQAKRSDRIQLSSKQYEQHVVIDRTRPTDYEIYGIEKITGHSANDGEERDFRPFYSRFDDDQGDDGCFFSSRREPRLGAPPGRRQHIRTGYGGSEVFVSLVDQGEAPYADALRHITVHALCTNRDLPLLMPLGASSDFSLRMSAPIERIKIVRGPTAPRPAIAENETTWRLISHLGLNYLTLTDLDEKQGAQALRELLELYVGVSGSAAQQVQGVRSMRLAPVYRQWPEPGPIVFARGVQIALLLDETAFSGASTYLFGAVLAQVMARHVSLNSFTELVVSTLQNGEVARWQPRIGQRPVA